MFKLNLDYPTREDEKKVVFKTFEKQEPKNVLSKEDILSCQKAVNNIFIDEKVVEYILDIVISTRSDSRQIPDMTKLVRFGASPRASIFLSLASKARAFLKGRSFVTPDDVKSVAVDILRHRIILTYEAEIDGITTEDVVKKVLSNISSP